MSNFKNVLGIAKAVIGVGSVVYVGFSLGKKVVNLISNKIKSTKKELKQIEETEV